MRPVHVRLTATTAHPVVVTDAVDQLSRVGAELVLDGAEITLSVSRDGEPEEIR